MTFANKKSTKWYSYRISEMNEFNWMNDIACYRASHGDRGSSKHLLGGGGDVEPHMLGMRAVLLDDLVVGGDVVVGVDDDV